MDNVTWITFHSAYDFGYLLAQLTSQKLPDSETEFLSSLKIFFLNLYDIKYLIMNTDNLMGGLQSVANRMKVKRIGSQHQAGSDSLLTGQVFFKIYDKYFSEGGAGRRQILRPNLRVQLVSHASSEHRKYRTSFLQLSQDYG